MNNATIFEIQRGSVQDGPGVRTTVFLKGCPLHCAWCHNPESQNCAPQISFHSRLCIHCGACVAVCPVGVHTFDKKGVHHVDFESCTGCGSCETVCSGKALRLYGKKYTALELFEIIEKDKLFYECSGGGITLSGGEPLLQAAFSAELLGMCREAGIHTCVETSGYGSLQAWKKLLPVTNLFLFDWKISNRKDTERFLGVQTDSILKNLEYGAEQGAKILLRCPVIPEVNDNEEHFYSILSLLRRYPAIIGAELLPYHNFGVNKSKNIGKASVAFPVPTEQQKKEWISYFRQQGELRVTLY